MYCGGVGEGPEIWEPEISGVHVEMVDWKTALSSTHNRFQDTDLKVVVTVLWVTTLRKNRDRNCGGVGKG